MTAGLMRLTKRVLTCLLISFHKRELESSRTMTRQRKCAQLLLAAIVAVGALSSFMPLARITVQDKSVTFSKAEETGLRSGRRQVNPELNKAPGMIIQRDVNDTSRDDQIEHHGDNQSSGSMIISPVSSPAECADPSLGPDYTTLRMVDDITQEADIDLVLDLHRGPLFDKIPKPIMTSRYNIESLCQQHHWKFCDTAESPEKITENVQFYTCENRHFIAKVECAYIDSRERVYSGAVYTYERRLPVHYAQPIDPSWTLNAHYDNLERHTALSHNLAAYPWAPAHTLERLPRLFLLIKGLPEEVPILMPDSPMSRGIIAMLDKFEILPLSRIIWWDVNKLYFADTVYFAGEMGLLPREQASADSKAWSTLRVERCSWATSMPRKLVQEILHPFLLEPADRPRILVVNRKDASTRAVVNHEELTRVLKRTLSAISPVDIVEFVGSDHDVEESFRLFANADVVVAPHGAALAFTCVMRPTKAVVELAYTGDRGMVWPSAYFHSMSVGSGLRYHISLADGDYGSPMTAHVQDVVDLVRIALANDPSLPTG